MIRVALVATVHCDHKEPDGTLCRRFDEHEQRPEADVEYDSTRLARVARVCFENRGWVIGESAAYCSDHAPQPRKGVAR